MQWAVEYQIASGTIWLCLFRANSDEEAQAYVKYMCTLSPDIRICQLRKLPANVTVLDLYKLFPRYPDNSNEQ